MDRSDYSSFLGALLNSFTRSFGFNKSQTNIKEAEAGTENGTNSDEENTDIENVSNSVIGANKIYNVVNNLRSDTIHFLPDKVRLVERILSDSLRLCSRSHKNGDIFKTYDGSVTVTLYVSTNKLHVQGANCRQWSDEFVERFERENLNHVDESETSLKEILNPQMTSTPNKITNDETYAGERGDDSMMATMIAMSRELEQLRERLAKLETPAKVVASVSTQTGNIKTRSIETMTEFEEKKAVNRHVQCELIHEAKEIPKTMKDNATMTSPSPQQTNMHPKPYSSNETAPRSSHNQRETTLIIGSSILQRIRTRGLKRDVRVKTLRGARLPRIRDELKKIDLNRLKGVIVQAGGNDVSSGRNNDDIKCDFIDIVTDIRRRSPNTEIFVAEVIPRVDADVTDINSIIRSVCSKYGAKTIQSTKFISKVNPKHHWKDGVHLSDAGTAQLLRVYEEYTPVLKPKSSRPCCPYCSENGHNAQNCRHGAKLQCYMCGYYGHKAKFCSWGHY